jgi:uncharacterized CHY-type Zn-finger protein
MNEVNKEKWSEEKRKKVIDYIYEKNYGRKFSESIAHNICVICGGEAKEFTTEKYRKDYLNTGNCQKCATDLEEKIKKMVEISNNIRMRYTERN